MLYSFTSVTAGKGLPDSVINLLPEDFAEYAKGEQVTAKQPAETKVKDGDGSWVFKGYQADKETVSDHDITFDGEWAFEKEAANDTVVRVYWDCDCGRNPYYNPADKGKELTMHYYWWMRDWDENGKGRNFYTPVEETQMKIGEYKEFYLNLKEVYDREGKKHENAELAWFCVDNTKHHIGRVAVGGGKNGEPFERYVLEQVVNTHVTNQIPADQVILPKHKNNLGVRYTIDMYSVKKGKKLTSKMQFLTTRDGQKEWLSTGDKLIGAYDLYNTYAGKYQEDRMTAQLVDAEMDKYYDLEVEGDDLIGWTVTLKSHLVLEERTQEEKIPFAVQRQANPKMKAGEEKKIQEGENRKKQVTYAQYKFVEPNGTKSLVYEEKKGEAVIKEAKPEIIQYGTKGMDLEDTAVTTLTETREETTAQPPEEIRENPNLPVGTRNVIQQGHGEKIKLPMK